MVEFTDEDLYKINELSNSGSLNWLSLLDKLKYIIKIYENVDRDKIEFTDFPDLFLKKTTLDNNCLLSFNSEFDKIFRFFKQF